MLLSEWAIFRSGRNSLGSTPDHIMEFITWFADVREKELQLHLHLHPGADHLGRLTQEDQRGIRLV